MIDINKQSQTAGNDSTQLQNCNITIVQGIDEKRVREIFSELFERAKRDFTQEAWELAKQRVDEFEAVLIPKLMETEERINALKDPSFQFILAEANKKAACVDRKNDFELLSELLIRRTTDVSNRSKNAGLNIAVNIVDQLDDLTLRGLTLAYLIRQYGPVTGNISEGLLTLDRLYGSVIDEDLPTGNEWIEELDLLKCLRIVNFNTPLMLIDILKKDYDGYFCAGIKDGSPEYEKACSFIAKYNLPNNSLVPHELIKGNFRVPVASKEFIDKHEFMIYKPNEAVNAKYVPLTDEQKEVVKEMFDLCNKDNPEAAIKQLINDKISEYHNIKNVMKWWDSIPIGFNFSSAGKALAYANARRLYPELPEIET